MSEQTELKPCAHCKGEAYADDIASTLVIGCLECGIRLPIFKDPQKGIAAWNTRADTLTQEERDVLTIWRHIKKHDGDFKRDYTILLSPPPEHEWYAWDAKIDGSDWLHAAAEWVRSQEAQT